MDNTPPLPSTSSSVTPLILLAIIFAVFIEYTDVVSTAEPSAYPREVG